MMKGMIAGFIIATAVAIGGAVADEQHVGVGNGVICPKGEIFDENEKHCVPDVPNTGAGGGAPAVNGTASPGINSTRPDSGTVQYPNHGTGGPSDAPPK
jgi:hypothetical protein